MTKLRSLGVAAVFLAGCAVGGASAGIARFVVPTASAQQSAQIPKWEYFCVEQENLNDRDVFITYAKQLGPQGWELAAASGEGTSARMQWCFKRQKL